MSRKYAPRKIQSVGNPTVVRGGFAQEAPKDRRSKTTNKGQQGIGVCASCGVETTLRKVTSNAPSRFGDLPNDTPVLSQHRAGGGRYSARRGDVLCPGAAQIPRIKPVSPNKTEET